MTPENVNGEWPPSAVLKIRHPITCNTDRQECPTADWPGEGLVCRDGVELFGRGLALVKSPVDQTQGRAEWPRPVLSKS